MIERMLIVPDAHHPYVDVRAWALMLKVAKDLKPHRIITMGDFGDFYTVNVSHIKDVKRDRKLKWEVEACNKALDQLDSLGAKHKTFLGGNHCDRLARYLNTKAPELFDVVSIPGLLKLSERDWQYVPYKHHVKVGKLYYTHDVGCAGRSAPFRALDVYKHGVVTGHTHKMAYIVEGNRAGDTQLSAIFGWLGDASQIDYQQRGKAIRDCALGFGIGHHDKSSGLTYLTPIPIVRYTCCVNGKIYRG